MPEPICPNADLERLSGLAFEASQQGYRLAGRHLEQISAILDRLRDAQIAGRVLPNPDDDSRWDYKIMERIACGRDLIVRTEWPDGTITKEVVVKASKAVL